MPVQVDQRKRTDFGEPPGSVNPGQAGTVYGTAPSGYTALQYADPATFVGADPNPALRRRRRAHVHGRRHGLARARARRHRPRGTRRCRRDADPRRRSARQRRPGLHLPVPDSTGTRKPAAERDYVTYDFRLDSGPYKSHVQARRRSQPRALDGSRPRITRSASPTAGTTTGSCFAMGPPTPVDVLDGFKFGFGPGNCGRSEATFNDGEGAFVANIDGPVRAIRSYVGANSGPRTERTHYFYADRDEIVTDLRVHPVPGPLLYHDLSAAGRGMTFRSSASPGGVPVDGAADNVSSKPADLGALVRRAGQRCFAADRVRSSFGGALRCRRRAPSTSTTLTPLVCAVLGRRPRVRPVRLPLDRGHAQHRPGARAGGHDALDHDRDPRRARRQGRPAPRSSRVRSTRR